MELKSNQKSALDKGKESRGINDRYLFLIGGGENGRSGHQYETGIIDCSILELCNKKKPTITYIGVNSTFAEYYFFVLKNIFVKKYGCTMFRITLDDILAKEPARQKLLNSDIVYIGGGSSKQLLTVFQSYGFDKLLYEQYKKNLICGGICAGAHCWGNIMLTRTEIEAEQSTQTVCFDALNGFGWVDLLFCPHYNVELDRAEAFRNYIKNENGKVAIACDNGVALIIKNEKSLRIVTSIPNAKVRLLYWNKEKLSQLYLSENQEYDLKKDLLEYVHHKRSYVDVL